MPDKPTPPADSPLLRDDADIDTDREDPPTPKKADGDAPGLDGTKATPGDDAEDDD